MKEFEIYYVAREVNAYKVTVKAENINEAIRIVEEWNETEQELDAEMEECLDSEGPEEVIALGEWIPDEVVTTSTGVKVTSKKLIPYEDYESTEEKELKNM